MYSAGVAYSGQPYHQFDDGIGYTVINASSKDFTGQTFALTFTSVTEERFTTIPTNLDGLSTHDSVTAAYIDAALEGLPNGVIDSVSVSVSSNSTGADILGYVVEESNCDFLVVVTFDGTQVRK